MINKIKEAKNFINSKFSFDVDYGMALGTGIGNFTKIINVKYAINYSEIPHFPSSTVPGHEGKLIFGSIHGVNIICMAGRFHYYEGYSMQEITFPIRVLEALGVDKLILTNASGSLKKEIPAGSIVLLNDHINMMPEHPLRGQVDDRLGNRFPDMKNPYDLNENELIRSIAKANNIQIFDGVYYAIQGPSLETKAECRMARIMGADIIGMSTVPEVIVAVQLEMRINVISLATNLCDPDVFMIENTTVEEVIESAQKTEPKLSLIIDQYFKNLK